MKRTKRGEGEGRRRTRRVSLSSSGGGETAATGSLVQGGERRVSVRRRRVRGKIAAGGRGWPRGAAARRSGAVVPHTPCVRLSSTSTPGSTQRPNRLVGWLADWLAGWLTG